MIEMDRFVTTLQGEEDEVIERESVDSAATMRQPVTNDRYVFSAFVHWALVLSFNNSLQD